jgi:hypothetical protein
MYLGKEVLIMPAATVSILTYEYQANPLGIDAITPRLMFKCILTGTGRGSTGWPTAGVQFLRKSAGGYWMLVPNWVCISFAMLFLSTLSVPKYTSKKI